MASVARLRGFVGQGMSVKRTGFNVLKYVDLTASGSSTVIAPNARCQAEAFIWAAATGPSSASGGAGGAEAVYKRFVCTPRQAIPVTVGAATSNANPGNPSTLTLPNGLVIRANPGLLPSGPIGGLGGTGGNGDLNRAGGKGGDAAVDGSPGVLGGLGGTNDGSNGGGGGAGGFSDFGDLPGGPGGPGAGAAGFPGGGAGGSAGAALGGAGRIVIIFTRLRS